MSTPARSESTALSVLKEIVALLLRGGRPLVSEVNASLVEDDPAWDDTQCTRKHVAILWRDLQRAATNVIGSALSRKVDDWQDDWTSRIVVAEPDEFVEYDEDNPWGWRPLADAPSAHGGEPDHLRPERWIWRTCVPVDWGTPNRGVAVGQAGKGETPTTRSDHNG